jgi:hypothetical protein
VTNRRRYVVGLGAAVLVAAAIVLAVRSHGDGGAGSARKAPAAHRGLRTAPPADWVAEADAVCRLGRKLYPNIALGSAGETDTVDYAIGRLVTEITAIEAPPPSSRPELDVHGRAAVEAWHSLATRSDDRVTRADKQEAARTAVHYVNDLVALGAAACAPLRPRTA